MHIMIRKQIMGHVMPNIRRIQFRKFMADLNKKSAQTMEKNCSSKSYTSFNQLVESRRLQANRSIVIQIKNESSYQDLISYSLNFGKIKNSFYYSISGDDGVKNFVLIEYDDAAAVQAVFQESQHSELENVIPVTSPFLWLRVDKNRSKLRTEFPKLQIECNELPSMEELNNFLSSSNSFSDDIVVLYNKTKLGEIGSRLRFLTAIQLEAAFKVLFSTCKVLPFGSSINSFGKLNCDLDLVMELREQKNSDASRFIFHSKILGGMNKVHNQRPLEIIADVIQFCLPGCCNTRRILKARVPIIKYQHELTNVDVDVSCMNLSGVYMSELLYTLGAFDWRVRPLVFAVRCWAKEINLTNPTPGKWVTNFMLTLLVLFYLQCEKLLPTVQTLVNSKKPEDDRVFIDSGGNEINCGFLTDLNFLKGSNTVPNNDNLFTLLFKFFEFYSKFDFYSAAISLNSGKIITKPDYDPMYVVNPLEKGLNVCKNVSLEECDRFRIQCLNAAWNMECSLNTLDDDHKKFGFFDLIRRQLHNKTAYHGGRGMKATKKLDVQSLFDQSEETIMINSFKKTKNV